MNSGFQASSLTLPSGLTLPYVEQGDPAGTTLVLIHAVADSWRIFEPLLADLPPAIHVLAPTQRGHGDASKPASGYRSSDFSADVLAFLDALAIERAVIAGGSSGGLVAQRFAIDHPERTRGLVLLGAPLRLSDKTHVRKLWDEVISRLQDPIDAEFVRGFDEQIAQHVPSELFEILVEENLKVPARVWREGFEGAMLDDFSAELVRISAPALILWGDQDALLTREDEETLCSEIPNARMVVYEGAGHLLYVEQPGRVAHDVAEFIESLEAEAGEAIASA